MPSRDPLEVCPTSWCDCLLIYLSKRQTPGLSLLSHRLRYLLSSTGADDASLASFHVRESRNKTKGFWGVLDLLFRIQPVHLSVCRLFILLSTGCSSFFLQTVYLLVYRLFTFLSAGFSSFCLQTVHLSFYRLFPFLSTGCSPFYLQAVQRFVYKLFIFLTTGYSSFFLQAVHLSIYGLFTFLSTDCSSSAVCPWE